MVLAEAELQREAIALRSDLDQLGRRMQAEPLAFARRLPWQEVAWALVTGAPWRSEWGAAPTCPPKTVCVVSANRTGKSTFGGMALAAAAHGMLSRFRFVGESWGGMPTLGDSVAVQRPHVEHWLGDQAHWYPREGNVAASSVALLRDQGSRIRLKGYEQGREKWQGARCQLIVMDEQPPDDVLSEARMRLTDDDGLMLAIFTPLGGVQSSLYADAYEPWCAYRDRHPGAKWGEVAPGLWVVSLGMRDNARSVGGFLPDERIEADEAQLIARGRAMEARVRYHGEWVDVSEDRIIPVELWTTYSEPPREGYAELIAWIDPAYSARTSSCHSAIAVVGRRQSGLLDLIETRSGQWEPAERERTCIEVLRAHDCPTTHVQRVGGDVEFAHSLNGALMRQGLRSCVTPWPAKGHVPDKVTRANQFATLVATRQFRARDEHVEVKRQAALMSASYLAAGGICDALDAAMGAALRAAERPMDPAYLAAVKAAEIRPRTAGQPEQAAEWVLDEPADDWAYQGDIMREVD